MCKILKIKHTCQMYELHVEPVCLNSLHQASFACIKVVIV